RGEADLLEVAERLGERLPRLAGLAPVRDGVGGDAVGHSATGRPVRADSYTPVMTPMDCRLVSRSTRSRSVPSRAPRKFRYCSRCESDSCPGSRPAAGTSRADVAPYDCSAASPPGGGVSKKPS